MLRPITERRRRQAAERADREQPRNTLLAREAPQYPMPIFSGLAQLSHIAQHHPGFPRQRAQRHHTGLHRRRIGVIAVIVNLRPSRPGPTRQPAIDRRRRRQTAGNALAGHAHRMRHGRGGKRIHHVMPTRIAQRDPPRIAGYRQHQRLRRRRRRMPGHRAIRAPASGKADDAPLPRAGAPLLGIGIVSVDHRNAALGQPGVKLPLGVGNAVQAAETFQMRRPGIVHQTHIGRGDGRQTGDLTGMIGAHFDHREAMRGRQTAQRQRQPNVIVPIARRRQHRVGLAQYRRQHRLDRGLTVAAGNRQHRRRHPPPPIRRQRAQRPPRVIHRNHRQPLKTRALSALDHRRRRAGGQRRRDKIVAVKARPGQRHEQRPGQHLAGIAEHPGQRHRRPLPHAPDDASRLHRRQPNHAAHRASAAATAAASLNGRASAP